MKNQEQCSGHRPFINLIWFLAHYIVYPITVPAFWIESILEKRGHRQLTPWGNAIYYLSLTAFSTIVIIYPVPLLARAMGVYLVVAMEVQAVWKCILIASGQPGIMYPRFEVLGIAKERKLSDRNLLTPTATFIGIVAFGYTVYTFALLDLLLYSHSPDAFFGVNAGSRLMLLWQFIYFSTVTITTLGYGEIHPQSTLAQMSVVAELGLGLFFIIFVFGVFVSYHVNRIGNPEKDRESPDNREPK